MERRNKLEFNNPHQELIQTYPILREQPLFVLTLVKEIQDNLEKSRFPESHRSSSQSKELEEKVKMTLENKLIPIVDVISRIDQDEYVRESDSLMDKFKDILSPENLVESSGRKGGKISRISKINAIINILNYYGKEYIPSTYAKDSELKDSHLKRIVSLIVDLLYEKIIIGQVSVQSPNYAYEFSGYGKKVEEAITSSFNTLGFSMKTDAKKNYDSNGKPIPADSFILKVDVAATNDLEG